MCIDLPRYQFNSVGPSPYWPCQNDPVVSKVTRSTACNTPRTLSSTFRCPGRVATPAPPKFVYTTKPGWTSPTAILSACKSQASDCFAHHVDGGFGGAVSVVSTRSVVRDGSHERGNDNDFATITTAVVVLFGSRPAQIREQRLRQHHQGCHGVQVVTKAQSFRRNMFQRLRLVQGVRIVLVVAVKLFRWSVGAGVVNQQVNGDDTITSYRYCFLCRYPKQARLIAAGRPPHRP